MSRSLTLIIPGDVGELSPNRRLHYHAAADKIKRWRVEAKLEALQARWPDEPRRIRLSFIVRRARLLDHAQVYGSKALKGAEDGIVDAGIVPDDRPKYVEWGQVRQEIAPEYRLRPELVVLIEEIS